MCVGLGVRSIESIRSRVYSLGFRIFGLRFIVYVGLSVHTSQNLQGLGCYRHRLYAASRF